MSGVGLFLIGVAVGLILGGLSTYGALLAWAMRQGNEDEEQEFEE